MSLRKKPPKKTESLDGKYGQVLTEVYTARYLDINQVNRLCFGNQSGKYPGKVLRSLETWGYLATRSRLSVEPNAYYLGVKGRHWITKQGIASTKLCKRVSGVEGSYSSLEHDLKLSGIYVALVLQCRQFGLSCAWKHTQMLVVEKLGIEPDFWLSVSSQKGSKTAYGEYTSYLPHPTEMQGKLTRYSALFAKQGASDILWFANTLNGLKQLAREIDKWEHRQRVFLGLEEDKGKFLTGKIWTWCGQPDHRWVRIAGAD